MSGLSNIKSKLLAEQVQEQIYQYILEQQYETGSRIPNEFQLASRFGVGRSTIREAVKLLISRGVLEVRRGSGTYVVSTAPTDLDPLGLLQFEDKMGLALDLANVRLMLEPGIAEMAALNATEEDIQKLRELCDVVEHKILAGESYIQEDIAFHTCVAACAKNKVVEQLIPIIDTAVLMFVNVTHTQLKEETIRTHRNVVNAIADHDPIGARGAMMTHMTYNRELICRLKKEKEASPG
ncbi:MAG TPA: FadR family transcriptional regulator [Candidatus Ventrimonas merdavium]|nr:FadR family transcriptional regulator [Candidatus Ventrimonas merdavium]